jgi:hypothetical protein
VLGKWAAYLSSVQALTSRMRLVVARDCILGRTRNTRLPRIALACGLLAPTAEKAMAASSTPTADTFSVTTEVPSTPSSCKLIMKMLFAPPPPHTHTHTHTQNQTSRSPSKKNDGLEWPFAGYKTNRIKKSPALATAAQNLLVERKS